MFPTAVNYSMSLTLPLTDMTMQISLGYFLTDLAMILWFYPSLGGLEYVSVFMLVSVVIKP